MSSPFTEKDLFLIIPHNGLFCQYTLPRPSVCDKMGASVKKGFCTSMLFANYHSHTPRCNHAHGEEREYIETAIKAGYSVLGFSDHSPQVFDGYVAGGGGGLR